ncbi:hypothetical protein Tco_0388691 [Tanacetum coccineum]
MFPEVGFPGRYVPTRKIEESLNVTFDETPPPSKTSPLVDDDLDEEEAIREIKKKNLENIVEDETLEIDEIVNIKESRNHPLENVIGNLNQRTLRSQAQNQSNFFCFISTIEPKNVNEALGDESWIVAMQEELNQFIANDVWELVPQPKNMTIIGTKWVFRNKLDENGIVSRNKARILLAYACALDFKLFKMDVKSAFLNGFINEEGTFIEYMNVEESYSKAMLAIDGTGFDWSYMEDKEASTNFALMAFSDFEVQNNKTCSKTYLKNFKDLKSKYNKLRIELNKFESDLDSYKKGLASVEEQLVFYKKNESMLCDQIAVLKRDASFNESDINALKKEKEDNQFKIDNFENASKSLDQLIGNQISDNNKKGLGYNDVPPPLTGLFAPPSIDLSNSGLEKFKQPEFEGYGVKVNKGASENVSKEVKKTSDAPIIEDWVSDCDEDETVVLESLNVQKPKQADQPRKVSQNPRNNSTSWNTPMPKKLGVGFQFTPKACFVCGSFNHLIKDCDFHDKRMVQKPVLNNVKKGTAVLTKSGLVPFSTARQSFSRTIAPVSAARNTGSCICKQFNYLDPNRPGKQSKESHDSDANNVDKESQKIERQSSVMILDAEEYLILEDPVKQGRIMERYTFEEVYRKLCLELILLVIEMENLEFYDDHNIVSWEYILLGMTEAKDSEVCKITRADGSSSFHGDIQALLRKLDRQDLRQLYSLVQERFKDHPLEGHDLDLWGALMIGVHSLFLDGTSIQINMLVEKKYPLKKAILEKMINLKIEAEEDSNMAIELIKFIKSHNRVSYDECLKANRKGS